MGMRWAAILAWSLGGDLEQAVRAGRDLADQGRYHEAMQTLRAAVEEAVSKGGESATLATAWNNLGAVYDEVGKLPEAERAFKRSIEIWEKAGGPENASLAQPLNNLALLYGKRRQYARAEVTLRRSLAIRTREAGAQHVAVARIWNNLGHLAHARRRYREAEALYLQALSIYQVHPDTLAEDLAATRNNMGALCRAQGRKAEAETHLRVALELLERSLGPTHPTVAKGLLNLAEVYGVRGEPYYQRALAVAQKSLGPSHPLVGKILANYAGALEKAGRKREAGRLRKQAEAILAENSEYTFAQHTVELTPSRSTR